MGIESAPQVIRRPDADVTIVQLEKVDVPHGNSLPTLIFGASGDTPTPKRLSASAHKGGLPPEAEGVGWRCRRSGANQSLGRIP
jgi:hypothetical protein